MPKLWYYYFSKLRPKYCGSFFSGQGIYIYINFLLLSLPYSELSMVGGPLTWRLPLTSWCRKSSNMTIGQSSLISLTHRCYDWHPGSRCSLTYNQLTSKVDGGSGGQLSPSVRPHNLAILTPLGNSGLCLTVFARNWDRAVPALGNGDLQTLICVLVARPRRCPTTSNPVPWQNWMAAYLNYTLRMKTLFRGWPVMVHDTHTRRRRLTYHCPSVIWHCWLGHLSHYLWCVESDIKPCYTH